MTGPSGLLRRDATTALILLSWSAVVVPRLLQTLTADKTRNVVGAAGAYALPVKLTELGLLGALAGLCVLVVLQHLDDLPARRRRALVALLAPWFYLVVRDLYTGRVPSRPEQVLYPMLVVAAWVLRPRLERLALVGYLTGATATMSLLLGVLLPDRGIYRNTLGEFVSPEKQVASWGVLIGPFTDGNNLGQVLVLGLPAVVLARRRHRLPLLLVTCLALAWTASRSSLAAVVVGATVLVALRAVTTRGRQVLATLVLGLLAAVVVALPAVTVEPTAFTNRGDIWIRSLEAWARNPAFGLGSTWYSEVAKYSGSLGGFAFHGHNQALHVLVTGGLVYAVLVTFAALTVGGAATRWARRGVDYPTVFLATVLASCALEVSLGVVDRDFLLAVSTVPLVLVVFAAPPGRARSPAGAAPPSARASGAPLATATSR